MILFLLILAALLIGIPSACLVIVMRTERKRDEMDRKILKELHGNHYGEDEREG